MPMLLPMEKVKGRYLINKFPLSFLASMEVTFAVCVLVYVLKKESQHIKNEDLLLKTLLIACKPQ